MTINPDTLPLKDNASWWLIPEVGGTQTPDFYTLVEDESGTQTYVPFYEALTEAADGTRRTIAFLTYVNVDENYISRWFGPDEVVETVEEVAFQAWCDGFYIPDITDDMDGQILYYEANNGVWELVHEALYEVIEEAGY